ncbi:ATP-binding cassette domain-containing protein [Arthrobacter antibioticus]|uniref:ATP-binding cassette domain-containing protein n=1 Tax=Arthrobacter sp. H35-MC1 TaxID=3046203 RepID=UPI0024B96F00|nr:ATP-binding cassette domain-containing protein [Arthrobacter sp. H35-MC1]MDJ0317803.1 ATP-binding cassette domain-containing protein [Arthrobacter sp. H35-MC1]
MQIHANHLALSAGRGPVYGPLTFSLDSGLNVLRGDAGTGRTSLLLTLAGRMKHDAGTLTVGGEELPRNLRAVQKISAVAGFTGIDGLEESVTVGAALRERRAWLSPWWSLVRKLTDADVARIAAPVFGPEAIPAATTVIWDLTDTQKMLLRISLAMMAKPEFLFVDDVEQIRGTESRAIIWDRLAWLAAGKTTVVVSASSLDVGLWEALDIQPHIVDLNDQEPPAEIEPVAHDVTDTNTDTDTPSETATEQHELIEEII